MLDGVPEPVQRPDTRVPAPREHHLGDTTGADELVVDDVGGEPAHGEVAAALADDLMAGGVGDQVGEALERHRVAVSDQLGDGVGQRGDLSQRCGAGSP